MSIEVIKDSDSLFIYDKKNNVYLHIINASFIESLSQTSNFHISEVLTRNGIHEDAIFRIKEYINQFKQL